MTDLTTYTQTYLLDTYFTSPFSTSNVVLVNGWTVLSTFKVYVDFAELGCSAPEGPEACELLHNPLSLCQLYVALVLYPSSFYGVFPATVCQNLPVPANFSVISSQGQLIAYSNYIVRSRDPSQTYRFRWNLCQDCDTSLIKVLNGGALVLQYGYCCTGPHARVPNGFLTKGWYSYDADPLSKDV